MLPIQLTIEGLYSYQEKQTIDFEPLISNQLFGIFGEVGSGKSAILEAIIFAIYGESDRLNARDSRSYNMMNLQSNRLLIDFTCWAGASGKDKYRFTVEAKRNTKRYDDVRSPNRRVFKWQEGQWMALEHARAEKIIGMSHKNFRQTVIIPQGKFRDFIQQTTGERTKMLQELFQLDQFDLDRQARMLASRNRIELERMEAKLESYEEYSEQRSKELAETLKHLKNEQAEALKTLTTAQAVLKSLEELYLLTEEHQQLSKKHEALLEQKEIIALKERQLEDYQRATAHFSDKLKLLTELELEYKHSQEQLSGLREKQKSLADRQQTQSKLVEAAKSAYLKRDEIRQTCDDLEHIIQVQRSEKERVEIADELKAYAARLTEMELQMKQITEQLVEHEEIIQKEKEQMDDIAQLKDLASIFQQLDQLTQQRMKLEGAHQVRHDRQLAIASRINKLSERFAAKYQMVLEGDELPEMNPEVLEKQVEQIDEQLLDLQQRNVFAKHASQLEDGEPCPLCGSEHHPHLAHTPAILSEMEDLKAQKQRLKEQLKDLATLQLEVGKLGTELEQLGLQHHQYEETLVALAKQQQNLEQQKSAFEAHDLSAKAVSNRIAHYQERQQQLKKLEAKFIQLKDTLEACRKKVEVNKVEEHQRQNRLTKANAAVETHLASLKTLQYEKFKAYSIEDLEANHQKGQQKLMKLEAHYLKSQALQAELEKEIHTIDGQIQSLTTQFQSLKRKLQAIQQLIQDTLLETGFTKLEVVRDLLKLELNVSKEQDFIRQFYEELMKLEIRLKELSVRLDSNPFDHQALTDTRNRVKALELKQKEYVEQIAQTTQYLAINQKKLAEKRAYQASLKQFAIRQTNLKVFTDKLFKAKGFVEYVSTVYLQNLVWAANERFVKLTKNKMSLELDEGNDFIIRDFLNGGKTRALKTLSGGQTFQIALCLALALAENVKSLNQAEQSFFFLDEGFGTLDRSSLRIVFETLKSLQQENRIVGVISHVEELKQEIDVALLIENNSEKGSIISRSWI